ncbi:hypothetical protein R1flu_010574 [Riccia fluitans]|uniref:Uncharacterized protein n=1 Tax=Riccia fluitans TaxID=41844 RepID=A0ABD1Z5D4_9MARC
MPSIKLSEKGDLQYTQSANNSRQRRHVSPIKSIWRSESGVGVIPTIAIDPGRSVEIGGRGLEARRIGYVNRSEAAFEIGKVLPILALGSITWRLHFHRYQSASKPRRIQASEEVLLPWPC